MHINNNKDQLFYQLLCDLSQDIIKDTQAAAEKTIDLSSQFLGDDKQNLVEDFRTLCNTNETKNETPNTEHIKIVQQNMEQVVNKNTAIRSEVNIVLGAMQFTELLRQNLEGIQFSFETMTTTNTQNPDLIKLEMQEKMHTFEERKAFHEHVMHEPMPEEDQEITQDLIDQLIG